METLEVHAKDFLIKWVNAPESSSLKWQAKPLKKSINFAIYQRNENAIPSQESLVTNEEDTSDFSADSNEPGLPNRLNSQTSSTRMRSSSVASVNQITELGVFRSKSRSSTFSSNLNSSNLTLVKNYNKLLPDELVKGSFKAEKGGTFAFVFDNSFSKTVAKTVLFSTKISLKDNSAYADHQIKDTEVNALESESTSDNILRPKNGELMQGVLLKKRRKKMQGYTKRFFILNFKYGTLSYFKNNDNKLRGQMPITESIVSANSKSREIFVDSGMEVWDLKTLTGEDFDAWVSAFDTVKKRKSSQQDCETQGAGSNHELIISSHLEDLQWDVECLLGDSDAISRSILQRRLNAMHNQIADLIEKLRSKNLTLEQSHNEFFDARDDMEEHPGVVLLGDKSQERKGSSDQDSADENDTSSEVSSSESDADSDDLPAPVGSLNEGSELEKGSSNIDLSPLPQEPIERNCDIPVCDHDPPSLLSFVRKNVGKDLSSLSMPVDMNEPITILQKYAELMEYSDIIDNAISGDYDDNNGELILRVAAFSVSSLSAMRMKVRSSRKPFNPLLGETYELIREDKGFRLLCEKVSHKPPVFAMIAEAKDWTFTFSPAPSQKFWGKTSEIYTKGTAKLTLRKTGDYFTWSQPTCVLKNIIAGEKYTEPSESVTVKSNTGQKAVVEFSKGGMFSGRSEEITITAFDSKKNKLPYTVGGKWTESMTLQTKSTEKQIWTAGALLPRCEKKFGFTEFAGSLNKVTALEEGNLPPTDSRLRPDLRTYENGNVSEAERLKQEVEENQRSRRKDLEASGKKYEPMYFRHMGGDSSDPTSGEWVYKTGPESYWERRKSKSWAGSISLW